jgi:hypothetical protein
MACHSVDGTKGTFDGNAKKGISSPFFLIHKAAHVAIPARRAIGGTDDLGYKTLVVIAKRIRKDRGVGSFHRSRKLRSWKMGPCGLSVELSSTHILLCTNCPPLCVYT